MAINSGGRSYTKEEGEILDKLIESRPSELSATEKKHGGDYVGNKKKTIFTKRDLTKRKIDKRLDPKIQQRIIDLLKGIESRGYTKTLNLLAKVPLDAQIIWSANNGWIAQTKTGKLIKFQAGGDLSSGIRNKGEIMITRKANPEGARLFDDYVKKSGEISKTVEKLKKWTNLKERIETIDIFISQLKKIIEICGNNKYSASTAHSQCVNVAKAYLKKYEEKKSFKGTKMLKQGRTTTRQTAIDTEAFIKSDQAVKKLHRLYGLFQNIINTDKNLEDVDLTGDASGPKVRTWMARHDEAFFVFDLIDLHDNKDHFTFEDMNFKKTLKWSRDPPFDNQVVGANLDLDDSIKTVGADLTELPVFDIENLHPVAEGFYLPPLLMAYRLSTKIHFKNSMFLVQPWLNLKGGLGSVGMSCSNSKFLSTATNITFHLNAQTTDSEALFALKDNMGDKILHAWKLMFDNLETSPSAENYLQSKRPQASGQFDKMLQLLGTNFPERKKYFKYLELSNITIDNNTPTIQKTEIDESGDVLMTTV